MSNIIKNKSDNSSIIKNSTNTVVKPAKNSTSTVVKPAKNSTSTIVKPAKNSTAKPYSKIKKREKRRRHRVSRQFSYKDNSASSVIADTQQFSADVKSHSQSEQLSEDGKSYLYRRNSYNSNTQEKSTVQKLADKKLRESALSSAKAEMEMPYEYENTQSQQEQQPYQYTDNHRTTEMAVKSDTPPHSNMVTSNSSFSSVKPKTPNVSGKGKGKPMGRVKNDNILIFSADMAKGTVRSQAERSDDTGIKTTAAAIGTAAAVVDILKPDTSLPKITKGVRRNPKINKASIAAASWKYGIKTQVRNTLKNSVSQTNTSIKKTVKKAGCAALGNIRDGISEAGENDLAFKAVDDTLNTIETAKTVSRGIKTAANAAVSTTRVIEKTVKGIYHLPDNVKIGTQKLKTKIRKLQKFRQMTKARQKMYTAKATKQAVKIIGETIKGTVIQLLGFLMGFILIFVLIAGVIFAVVGSVIWQTPTDLDTTKVISYISELDYNQQNKWFSKGKTNIEIEKHNDNSDKQWHYYYLLAKDVPPDIEISGTDVDESNVHCMVKTGFNSEGREISPSYRGFNLTYNSADEMLESYRWTTEDYRAALAYIQVHKSNLGWFSSLFGFVGEAQLKSAARQLHEKTYNYPIILKEIDGSDDTVEYSYQYPIYSLSYSGDNDSYYYYFGRKYSVKYLIDNDMLRFDSDDAKNQQMKEKFEYTYKYGNLAVGNLAFPLELETDEKISDRISKHFGKQLTLKYTPPDIPNDSSNDVYGNVSGTNSYHYANDLSADEGDIIYAPIGGLCKATQRDERGYEYVISTSYNGTDFDYTKNGYLVKISCSSATYISSAAPKVVKQGDWLGIVAGNTSANHTKPDNSNDTDNEDIFAHKLFPCSTDTAYSEIGANEFTIPPPDKAHIHIEMYKLPCDFTSAADMEKNVLAPELFFDYSKEDE